TAAFDRHLGAHGGGLFPFTLNTGDARAQVHARMFAPNLGLAEDPATGSAVAALAGWLAANGHARGDGTHRWTVAQGVEMGRPSLLELEADTARGRITAVRVGGGAVLVSEGEITPPPA